MKEVLVRVDVDATDDPFGNPAEVRLEMKQQVDAGGEQQQAA